MDSHHIAPCGMNCSLCVAYQFHNKDLNSKGFSKKSCPGCINCGQHCLHMGHKCELLKQGKVRFCFECVQYPCKMLQRLNKRYKDKYHMSMIENLEMFRSEGMDVFLKKQQLLWTCNVCKTEICCHNGLCLTCDLQVLLDNKKYCWGNH